MVYVFLSICCSVMVSVLLKLARRYEINVPQAVVWNYPVAALLTAFIYRPALSQVSFSDAPLAVYIILGILLPSLFVILGKSVRYTGIVRTDLAQRLSLFIPLVIAFALYREPLSWLKATGIITGFVAIICSVSWQKRSSGTVRRAVWMWPLVVFAGMGLIDVLFKQIAAYNAVPYTTSLFIVFVLAFFLSVVTFVAAIAAHKTTFNWLNLFCGLILGLFNFGNILFYLKAHRALPNNPSIVFSAMNIGVIVLGAIVGIFLFKERLSNVNKAGIVLAVIAIILLALSR